MIASSDIPDHVWMWVIGGTCALIMLLISVLGGFMLNSILKLKEEIKLFRIEFAENKGETLTWPKFTDVKTEMEKDRAVAIKLAISEHIEYYSHVKAS